jgi:TM2 domain-containing membrane protein YozV
MILKLIEFISKAAEVIDQYWRIVLVSLCIAFIFALVPGVKRFYRAVLNGIKEIFSKSGLFVLALLLIVMIIIFVKLGVFK